MTSATISELTTRQADILARRKQTQAELAGIGETLDSKRQALTRAILAGKPTDKIAADIDDLEGKQRGLSAWLAASEGASGEAGAELQEARALEGLAHVQELGEAINQAAPDLVRDMMELYTRAQVLTDQYNQAEGIIKRLKLQERVSHIGYKDAAQFGSELSQALEVIYLRAGKLHPQLLQAAGIPRKLI